MSTVKTLPVPKFFEPKAASDWGYRPDQLKLAEAAEEWRKRHGISAAATDKFRLHVLLIDVQKDFCFPEGSLYVGGRSGTGAIDDSRRIAEFLYKNLGVITDVTTTLDTHFAFQIFFAPFWVTEDGKPLSPHTLIDVAADGALVNLSLAGKVLNKNVRPNPAMTKWVCNGNYPWLVKQVEFYCRKLKEGGKYTLYLWPPHCILGSDGHALAGVVHEARMFHAFVRGAQSWCEVKGGNVLTENYSVLSPEVLVTWDGEAFAQKNTRFVKTLLESDAVVIAGQASSHCVKSSIDDLLTEIVAADPKLAGKVYILADCTSAVAVPDGKGGFLADFTPQADEALRKFAAAGMHVVKSTDPIGSWPGIGI